MDNSAKNEIKCFFVPPTVSADGTRLVLPQSDRVGYDLQLHGSSNKSVIALDGRVYAPLEDMTVKVMYKLVNQNDPLDVIVAKDEVAIAIPGLYKQEEGDNPRPQVLPAIREWKGHHGAFTLTESSRIVIADEALRETADMIAYYFDKMLGKTIAVETGAPADGDLHLALTDKVELGDEGYTIEIGDVVKATALTTKGILYAGTSIVQILSADEAKASLPRGLVRDYPAYAVRSCMYDVARYYMNLSYLDEIARYMAYYKCNEIHVHINDDGGQQKSCFRLQSLRYPEINCGNRGGKVYTQEDYRAFQKHVAKYGIKVITEIDTPSHAGFVRFHEPFANKALMFKGNETDIFDDKIDIYDIDVINFIKSVWDELTDGDDPVIQSDTVHIGGDEYFLFKPELFAKHRHHVAKYLNIIAQHLMKKGYKVNVWSEFGRDFYTGFEILDPSIRMYGCGEGHNNYDDIFEAGYRFINMVCEYLYIVPGVQPGVYANDISLGELYDLVEVNRVLPNRYEPESAPYIDGAQACVWNDYDVDWPEKKLFKVFQKEVVLISEKAWRGVYKAEGARDEFLDRVEKLGQYAPDADPLCCRRA